MPVVLAQKLTATRAENFTFNPAGPKLQRIWDNQVPGMGLETVASGRKSWIYRFRISGKQRIVTLGQFYDFDVDEAWDRALELRGQVREGSDPKTLHSKDRNIITVQDLYDSYTAGRYFLTRSKDFQANFKSTMFKYVLPTIGHLLIPDIKRWQVRQIVENLAEKGKEGMAQGTLTHLRVLFGYAIDKEYIDHSPADRIKVKRTTSGRRNQWMKSGAELKQAWHLDAPVQVRGIVRWALLTGCRRDEVRTSRKDWVNLELGIWTVPETKNKRPLVLPITESMWSVINEISATFPMSDYLFPATSDLKKELPRGTLDYIIRQSTGGEWSMHVLRHTVESWMADLGVVQEYRDLVLNHVRGTMSERYRHGLQLEAKRQALDIWHTKLMGIVNETC